MNWTLYREEDPDLTRGLLRWCIAGLVVREKQDGVAVRNCFRFVHVCTCAYWAALKRFFSHLQLVIPWE